MQSFESTSCAVTEHLAPDKQCKYFQRIRWTITPSGMSPTLAEYGGGVSRAINDIFMSTRTDTNGSTCDARNASRDKQFLLFPPVSFTPRNLFAGQKRTFSRRLLTGCRLHCGERAGNENYWAGGYLGRANLRIVLCTAQLRDYFRKHT